MSGPAYRLPYIHIFDKICVLADLNLGPVPKNEAGRPRLKPELQTLGDPLMVSDKKCLVDVIVWHGGESFVLSASRDELSQPVGQSREP